jgi:hypothetical protein
MSLTLPFRDLHFPHAACLNFVRENSDNEGHPIFLARQWDWLLMDSFVDKDVFDVTDPCFVSLS